VRFPWFRRHEHFLAPVVPIYRCAKCGYTVWPDLRAPQPIITYCTSTSLGHDGVEHLDLRCPRCGHVSTQPCADAKVPRRTA